MTISVEDSRAPLIVHDGVTATYNYSFQELDAANIAVYVDDPDIVVPEVKLTSPGDFLATPDSDGVGGSITLVTPANYTNLSSIRIVRETAALQGTRFTNTGSAYQEAFEAALDELTQMIQEARDIAEGSLKSKQSWAADFDAKSELIKNLLDPVDDQDAATKAWVQSQVAAAPSGPTAFAAARLAENSAGLWLTGLGVSGYMQALLSEANANSWIDAVGFSTIIENILKDANGADILTELGVSAFIQTLLDDTDVATARATLEIVPNPNPNLLVNGDFQIWPHGDSITAATTPDNSDGEYFAGQWLILSDGADAVDIARQPSFLPDSARSGAIVTVATANRKFALSQPIESGVSINRLGAKVSLGVDIRIVSGDLTDFRLMLVSWNSPGVQDAPTIDFVSAWNGATALPTPGTNWTILGEASFTADTSQNRFVLEDVSVPGNSLNLELVVMSNDSSFIATSQFVITSLKLEAGSVATPFISLTKEQELARCQRFFRSTFPDGTAPNENQGIDGAFTSLPAHDSSLAHLLARHYWDFHDDMLKEPTVLSYNPGASGANWLEDGSSNEKTVAFSAGSKRGVLIHSAIGSSASGLFRIHATADARF